MNNIPSSGNYSDHSFALPHVQAPEKTPVYEQPLASESLSLSAQGAKKVEPHEIPRSVAQHTNHPCQQRPPENIVSRQEEHSSDEQAERLRKKLKEMRKGLDKSRIPKPIRHPVDFGVKVAKQIWKSKGSLTKVMPAGIGSLLDSMDERKKASACRKEAKQIKKSLTGDPLPKEEVKSIKHEIKQKKTEMKNLRESLQQIDRNIADYSQSKSPSDAQITQRTEIQNKLNLLSGEIKILRCKLFTADIPQDKKQCLLDQMDQKLKEQHQHDRKGYGHGSRSLGSSLSTVFFASKAASIVGDIAVATTVLTPITASIGLAAGGVGVGLNARNLIKGNQSLKVLKEIKLEGKACKARARYEQSIADDRSRDEETRKTSRIKAQIELENAKLAKDYVRIQKKICHRKIVVNSIGLAENTSMIAASTTSLLTMIPEPTTSVTMFSITLGLTGLKYGLMLAKFSYGMGSEALEKRHEKKLNAKSDFDNNVEKSAGISTSQLGVEIRLAQMIKNGIALPSIVKYHGIIDEKGFVNHVSEMTKQKGDKQEYKKGLAVISNFAEHTEKTISDLAAQLPPEKLAA